MSRSGLRPVQTKRERLREALETLLGQSKPGDMIPAEREMCSLYDVSRGTVRLVLDDLVSEGRIERRHGSGTYVTQPKMAVMLSMTSFTEDMKRRGLRPASRVLEFTTRAADSKLARHLVISPGVDVYTVKRLRLADDRPMAIEILHVPAVRMPRLKRCDVETKSFYQLVDEHNIVLTSGSETIDATVVDDEEALLLEVPVHSPAFLFQRTAYDDEGSPIEYVRSIYRGDRYRIELDLKPSPA
ncbi:GntR family transcriptional regulator [Rhodococcus sp. IEGM 1409]|nr:GntR family transcriptional regulator [Rhodococcus sp. IEGM 1409]MDI9903166.1 GntR family transcriptional regulator [Rhodococcus sp. IEGM 1409]